MTKSQRTPQLDRNLGLTEIPAFATNLNCPRGLCRIFWAIANHISVALPPPFCLPTAFLSSNLSRDLPRVSGSLVERSSGRSCSNVNVLGWRRSFKGSALILVFCENSQSSSVKFSRQFFTERSLQFHECIRTY